MYIGLYWMWGTGEQAQALPQKSLQPSGKILNKWVGVSKGEAVVWRGEAIVPEEGTCEEGVRMRKGWSVRRMRRGWLDLLQPASSWPLPSQGTQHLPAFPQACLGQTAPWTCLPSPPASS